jgi:hypothetical protein
LGATIVVLASCGGSQAAGPNGDGGADAGVVQPDASADAPSDGATNGGFDSGSACSSNRVDVLFMVDNSASMSTKVDYLWAAVPEFLGRLARPNCIANGHVVAQSHDGVCDQGAIEFPPVTDMHVGVVTSALGPRGGDICDPNAKSGVLLKHNDDRAELVNRGGPDEHAVSNMTASNFLAWFPNVPANTGHTPPSTGVGDLSTLTLDFQDELSGVHDLGCGIESQLESWYRFLIQPDPYDSIDASSGTAKWVGVDTTILKQRHDFLRPDSLVLIVDLTDENDSEIDVRALGGQGYLWHRSDFTPPRGTGVCLTNPADPACTSCQINMNDPNCANGPYPAIQNDWGYNLNVRHVHMKQKYGLDVQFPIDRYVRGLTQTQVPNRGGTIAGDTIGGEYPPGAQNYVGKPNCTNPLFAASLPDGSSADPTTLCKLPMGTRSPELVFYAHIGGVPNQLLHVVPGDPVATSLTDADWQRLVGKDPLHYDLTGIDPHMIEDYKDRSQAPVPPGGFAVKPPSDPGAGSDPISGRDWITDATAVNGVDGEYACTFPLRNPKDCTQFANFEECDCPSSASGISHDQLPSVCDATTPTTQARGKAYPTIRELEVARALGSRGIVGSICPVHGTEMSPGDPLFGHRPAVTAIVDRVGVLLAKTCK